MENLPQLFRPAQISDSSGDNKTIEHWFPVSTCEFCNKTVFEDKQFNANCNHNQIESSSF